MEHFNVFLFNIRQKSIFPLFVSRVFNRMNGCKTTVLNHPFTHPTFPKMYWKVYQFIYTYFIQLVRHSIHRLISDHCSAHTLVGHVDAVGHDATTHLTHLTIRTWQIASTCGAMATVGVTTITTIPALQKHVYTEYWLDYYLINGGWF